MGIPYEESRERFQEALDIILEAWKGEPFSYEGKFNHIENATVSPSPYQKPHPMVRIASSGEDSFARVGRLGYPIFLSMRGMDVNDLQTNLKEYHKAWKEAGHPGEGDISVRIPMYIGLSEEAAVQEPKETIEAYFSRMRRFFDDEIGSNDQRTATRQSRAQRLANMTYEEILETKVIFGTPESVTDKLAQFKELLGLSAVTAELNPGGRLPKEAVNRSLRLLTEKVMPALR
jgi:alkanesulfonate monooxygenase SsuD/methylene tetrahydromethanopterin reductase-like flavin-dependent oxidoreductase (luciferase family)